MPLTRHVGNLAHLDMLKHQISARRLEIDRLRLQTATGKRVLSPSDDPPSAARSTLLKLRLENNQQLVSSVNQALEWIDASESGLSTVQRILADARLVVLQGANATQSAESRSALAQRLNQLLDELASTSTLQYGGDYLYSGERFDVPPYTFTRDGDGLITGLVAETNINGRVERLVDQNFKVEVNATPASVFGVDDPARVDIFQVLIDARDALLANDGDAAAALVTDLQDGEDQVTAAIAGLGATTVQLQGMLDRLDRRELGIEEEISDAEDADLAETLIDLQNQEVVLEAALRATARVNQLSLFDYI
jgi:flagellar hook-associated protein 3 FlgL